MIVSCLLYSIAELVLCILILASKFTNNSSFTLRLHTIHRSSQPNTPFRNDNGYHLRRISMTCLQSSGTVENDDAKLLQLVSKDMLQNLCQQYNISSHGTKPQLLHKLRDFAEKQVQDEKKRRHDRIRRVERGSDDEHDDGSVLPGKAKHTILENSNSIDKDNYTTVDEDDLDGVFYFSAPINLFNVTPTMDMMPYLDPNIASIITSDRPMNKIMSMKSSASVTAPPLHPSLIPNDKGERSVTVYSTTDQNDLTSVASHLSSSAPDMMMADTNKRATNSQQTNTLLEGPFGESTYSTRKKEMEKESDVADTILTDLVRNLLAMTGAPGFQDYNFHNDDDDDDVITFEEQDSFKQHKNFVQSRSTKGRKEIGFLGFDPSRVPTNMITQASKYLRVANGEPLRKVLSEFEIQGIGYDGMAGDDKRRGGGHYLEVKKVEAFLQGFRTAEIRRVARETTSLLLDRLISEGIKGLDRTLMLMSRGGDESSEVGELNDSLLSYLDNVIKQREQHIVWEIDAQTLHNFDCVSSDIDEESILWNITQTADGIIETLNPNVMVNEALQKEGNKILEMGTNAIMSTNQKLLMILKLLRDRIKVEALYPNDDNGQALRVLAYCLQSRTDHERKKLILDYFGSSLQRLDSFSELVRNALEYADSTSHQLQPSRNRPLNAKILLEIQAIVESIKKIQAWKASGLSEK